MTDIRARSASCRPETTAVELTLGPREFLAGTKNEVKRTSRRTKSLRLNGDDSVLDGVLYQIGVGLQLQEFHHAVFVRCNSPCGDFQCGSYFFHGAPFRQ